MGETGRLIGAELTATTRAGFLRFKFPASDASHVVVTACKSEAEGVQGFVQVNAAAREIVGYNPDRQSAHLGPPLPNFKGYFVVQFNIFGDLGGRRNFRRAHAAVRPTRRRLREVPDD
jgi:hypothetical protein